MVFLLIIFIDGLNASMDEFDALPEGSSSTDKGYLREQKILFIQKLV